MIDPILIAVLILLLACFAGLSWFAGTDAPYVPTKMDTLRKILKGLKIKKGQIFYELGSGDGRVVLEAGKLGAKAIGVEQSWIRVWFSRLSAKKENIKDTYFYHGNIYDREYYPADIVYIYMLQKCVDELEKKLKKELKTGAIIITQTYHFKNWKPFKKEGSFQVYKK